MLDIMLPGMKGTDALTYLKRQPATRDIPVVVVTGYPFDTTEDWCAMTAAILRKPFSLDEIRGTLARVIDCATRTRTP